MVLFQKCVRWFGPLTKMAAQLNLVQHRTLWEIRIKTILSGTSSSIRTKLWWNSHWMVLFQNCVRQSRSSTKMATTVQLRCYWKQLWFRWAITGSWEPLVVFYFYFVSPSNEGRHIVLVWFFFRFCFFSAKLVRTITCLSFEIGQWYLVCGCMAIRQCVAYRNDLCWTLTSRSNNCFLNSITC